LKQILARWGWFPLVAALIVAADQLTKAWLERAVPLGGGYAPISALVPYFMLVHWGNTGAAFGLLQGMGGIFATIALVVIVAVLAFSRQLPMETWGARLCLGLILGGAVGNQIDRIRVGHVTDFLLFQVPVGDRFYQWPAFNVADSSIVVGSILLAVVMLWVERKTAHPAKLQLKPEEPRE
jgi:signal peptidase II